MGSAAGLFVGASLLSFVEIFYFFIFRKYSETELRETPIKRKKNANPTIVDVKKDRRKLRPTYGALRTYSNSLRN